MNTPPTPPQRSGWADGSSYPPMPPVDVSPTPTTEPPGGRRAGWTLLVVFLVAYGAFLLASVTVLIPFYIADPQLAEGGTPSGAALVVALVAPTAIAALVAVGGVALLGRGTVIEKLRRELALRMRWRDVGLGFGLGALGLVITIPASALWAWWVGESQANSAVGEVFNDQRLPAALAIVLFLSVWLVAPLCEEVLYRGVLWRALQHWRWNRWLIFAATTVVFSLAHMELLRTPLLVVITLPIAFARMFTQSLPASIIAHQVNNFLPAVGLLLITLGVMPA